MYKQEFQDFEQVLAGIRSGRGSRTLDRKSTLRPLNSHNIPTKDVGGGDKRLIDQCIVEMLNSEYAEDLQRLPRVICYGHSPRSMDGDTPMGFACLITRAITVATRCDYADCLDTLKHELGHLKHGLSEELAERYAEEWF